ncbi:MAG: hypothetical protein ABIB71_02235 [Candidatus Woesearchaeota archaeon]
MLKELAILATFLGIIGCTRETAPNQELALLSKGIKTVEFDRTIRDQSGRFMALKELIKTSISEEPAKRYVNKMLDDFENKSGYYKDRGDDNLAEILIEGFWKDMSISGNGNYDHYKLREYEPPAESSFKGKILGLECKIKGISENQCFRTDSVQTLSEFISKRDPINGDNYLGDCDDFAMAMQTSYLLALEMAEERAKESKLWDTVANGLYNRPMYIADGDGTNPSISSSPARHNFNLWIDKTNFTVNILEPQSFLKKATPVFENGRFFVEKNSGIKYRIYDLCNLEGCKALDFSN